MEMLESNTPTETKNPEQQIPISMEPTTVILPPLRCKVLIYHDHYVNFNMLNKGIYNTATLTLYPPETTIDDLEQLWIILQNFQGAIDLRGPAIDNLRSCELVDVKLELERDV